MIEGVHPTALVDPKATLGTGVRIGAFAVVGPEVKLGAGVEIGHHCVLEGRIEIAERASVGHGSLLGGRPQDLKFRDDTPSGVRIGADTVIREYVTVHRATRAGGWTEIGSGCLIMSMSHVAHDCRIGDGAIVINYAGITGHCQIGERATIGGLVGMVPFTRIGAYAYIGGCSRINADVPPFVLAEGNPAWFSTIVVSGKSRARRAASPSCENGACSSKCRPRRARRAKPARQRASSIIPGRGLWRTPRTKACRVCASSTSAQSSRSSHAWATATVGNELAFRILSKKTISPSGSRGSHSASM